MGVHSSGGDRIKVHVLNFHGPWSHIEIVLENLSTDPCSFYNINRWSPASNYWGYYEDETIRPSLLKEASSTYAFEINADPDEIVNKWCSYYQRTEKAASILGDNCAVAVQWFLHEFAGIPAPSLQNLSVNYLAFGILWPSFIPCPVTLPGRIMSNVKAHIQKGESSTPVLDVYARAFVYLNMALATLEFAISLPVIATLLLVSAIVAACVALVVGTVRGLNYLLQSPCYIAATFFHSLDLANSSSILAEKNLPINLHQSFDYDSETDDESADPNDESADPNDDELLHFFKVD